MGKGKQTDKMQMQECGGVVDIIPAEESYRKRKGEEEVEERPFLRDRQSQRVCVCVCVWGRDDASFVAATASLENSQKKREGT